MVKWNEEYKVYVSDDGRVWNKDGYGYIQQLNKGYYRVNVRYGNRIRKQYLVHILVYKTFVGEIPKGFQIDHIDRDRLNNTVSNLRTVTASDNNKNRVLPEFKGKSLEFGEKFFEHYHQTKRTDLKLYNKEYHYWRHHRKCSWE